MGRRESANLSVITPVYNGGRFLAECIESVLAQTYTRFEYLICDDHSTDDTAAIVARYARLDPRIRVVRPGRFLPLVANHNYAASQASADSRYLKFVHADDTISPTCLERMVDVAERYPNVGVVGAPRRYGDGSVDLDAIPPTAEIVPGHWLIRHQLGGPYMTGPPTATLLRTTRTAREGRLYDETYVHADDVLSYRILLESDFGYVGEPMTCTRLHDRSTTSGWIARAGTWDVEHLRMALELGRFVMPMRELAPILATWEGRYERMLEKWTLSLKLVRDREVRAYHRTALARLELAARGSGYVLTPALRAYAAVLARDDAEPVTARLPHDDLSEPSPEPVAVFDSAQEGIAQHR